MEKGAWTRADTLAALLSLGGVVLIVKPQPFFGTSAREGVGDIVLGIVCAFTAAIAQAGLNMTIRLIRDENTSVITLYAMVSSVE